MSEDQNQTAAASAGESTERSSESRVVPQERVNRLEARWRRETEAALAKAAELEAELAKMREASKTEAEKAIERAREEARKQTADEYEARLIGERLDAELKIKLLSKGLDPDLAHLVKAKCQIKSVEEIDDAIRDALDGKEWLQKQARNIPTQSGAPSPGKDAAGQWTRERLESVLASGQARKLTADDWAKIEAARKAGGWF